MRYGVGNLRSGAKHPRAERIVGPALMNRTGAAGDADRGPLGVVVVVEEGAGAGLGGGGPAIGRRLAARTRHGGRGAERRVVNLPDIGGFDACRTLRERGDSVPILPLTGLGGVDVRVRGRPRSGPAALRVPRGEFVRSPQSSGSRTPPVRLLSVA